MNTPQDTSQFVPTDNKEFSAINALRFLAIDAVEKANSGHPGMPMGMAPAAYVLWAKHLRQTPHDPDWLNRDRFVLSAGHGSMLQYGLLHLNGYDLSLDDLKQFRQWGSKTPGHPETHVTKGVELTTGPLGQGLSSAVGLAIEESYLRALAQEELLPIDYRTYVIAGDGCLQEGVSSEAASLAGHLKLGRLIVLYDDNNITIDGPTHMSFSEDVGARYRAYGWQVIEDVDGTDPSEIDAAILEAKDDVLRPTLIHVKTTIGYGSPNKAGSHAAHGAPLGADEIQLTREELKWPHAAFVIPPAAYDAFKRQKDANWVAYLEWKTKFDNWKKLNVSGDPQGDNFEPLSPLATVLFPKSVQELADVFPEFDTGQNIATRSAQGEVLNHVMPHMPWVLGGSADLTPSNNTHFAGAVDYTPDTPTGRYIRYGVREHAMGSILNGLNAGKTLRAYAGTFLVFSDYMRAAIRVASLSGYPSIFVFTHDSIGLGEDGPTHQPVESLAALRAIPNLRVYRPADANETAQAWNMMLAESERPSSILLSRQKLPVLAKNPDAARGAYVVQSDGYCSSPASADVLLLASGSEVSLALKVQKKLGENGCAAAVISMMSWDVFEEQSDAYKASVLPDTKAQRVAIEAGIEQGWHKYIGRDGLFFGMASFGASAPADVLFEKFGLSVDAISDAILARRTTH